MACPNRRYDMSGKTVLVTGGNSGIGKATAAQLARAGAQVVITARDEAKAAAAVSDIRRQAGSDAVEVMMLDYANLASVRAFSKEFLDRYYRLDVLVHNAGCMQPRRQETADGFEYVLQANHLGPFLLTDLLLDRIRASAPARIVVVASASHKQVPGIDLDDLQSASGPYIGLRVYGRSKLCNVLFTRELAVRLSDSGVTVNALHPGSVRSGFGRDGDAGPLLELGMKIARPFFISSEQAARRVVYLAADPEVEGWTGGYYVRCRQKAVSRAARDSDTAARLWAESEHLIGRGA